MLRVARTACNQCLFSTGKIVSDERKADILEECEVNDQHFICHLFTVLQWQGKLTEDEADVCCNGFWRHDPNATTLLQIAGRLNMIQWIELPDEGLEAAHGRDQGLSAG